MLLLCLCPLPAELVGRVQGGLPGTEVNGTMYADYLLEMTTGGRMVTRSKSISTRFPIQPHGYSA